MNFDDIVRLLTTVGGASSIVGTVFYYAVMKPFTERLDRSDKRQEEAAKEFTKAIDKLTLQLEKMEDRRLEMADNISTVIADLAKIEQSDKSAHHRIDGIEIRMTTLESRRRATDK